MSISASDAYTDLRYPSAFTGLSTTKKFLEKQKADVRNIEDEFSKIPPYYYYKETKRKFKRRKTVAFYIDHRWQADLTPMEDFYEANDNVKHLLTCVDLFSRKLFVHPLKNKTSSAVKVGLETIFKNNKHRLPAQYNVRNGAPEELYTDNGKEFYGAVKLFLKQKKC